MDHLASLFTIKEGNLDDVVKINAAVHEMDTSYDKHYFYSRIKGKDPLVLVAYINDIAAGYTISYNRDTDGSYYCWMAGVDPEYRRLGILSGLLKTTGGYAKKMGYKVLRIKTRNKHRNMLTYLIKEGFNVIGFDPKDNTNVLENRVLFEKTL